MCATTVIKVDNNFNHVEKIDEAGYAIMSDMTSGAYTSAVSSFCKLKARDQAEVMATLKREHQAMLLSWLTPKKLGLIVNELQPNETIGMSRYMEAVQLSMVLDETNPDVAADVLRELPSDLQVETLSSMHAAKDVQALMAYEDDDAGGLMTPQFVALTETMNVSQAIHFVRRTSIERGFEDITYILVVDHNHTLKGGLNVSQLVTADPSDRITDVMYPEVISVTTDTDQEECARIMERYNLIALPVTDSFRRLVGVVKVEDMIDVVQEEATEDMYRMVGVGQEEKLLGPFWRSIANRLPWLCVNLGTAAIAALVITIFRDTISQIVILAAFLPVIAGQGGIVGTQTLTLMVRSMALGEVAHANAAKLLIREFGLGLVHGIVLGVVSGVVTFLWLGNFYLAVLVALAMLGNLVVAGISGVLLPLCLKVFRIDPALASAVLVTTITDVVGFLIFLGLAAWSVSLLLSGF